EKESPSSLMPIPHMAHTRDWPLLLSSPNLKVSDNPPPKMMISGRLMHRREDFPVSLLTLLVWDKASESLKEEFFGTSTMNQLMGPP
ncbi:MAG: hypothetical protein M1339_07905, partial [Bacteroidetes bacterium]|nr:hypothetical protein [Bacteroidota bacterium]